MFEQKKTIWSHDLRTLRSEISDLLRFEQHSRIFSWAFSRHPNLQEDELASFGEHLYNVEQTYAIIAIRRIVKQSGQGVSLLGTLSDFKKFRELAVRAFPALPTAAEIDRDISFLKAATKDIVDLSDKIFAHVDRNPANVSLWALTKVRDAVVAVLLIGAKYVRLLAQYAGDFKGEIPCVLARERDVRQFFGAAFVADEEAIPREVLKPVIETAEPIVNLHDPTGGGRT